MGGIVSAIGDVVGGVADVVGTVAEGAVDLAGSVIETVASNPLLMVAAAVAAPYALGAMAAEAAVGGAVAGLGVDAAAMGLIGPTLMGAVGATEAALSAAALSAGAGAGILGGGALAGGLTLAPAAIGSTEALSGAGAGASAAGSTAGFTGATGEIGPTSLLGNPVGFTGTTGEIGPTSLLGKIPDATQAVSQATNSMATSNTGLAVDNAVQNTTYQIGSQGGTFTDQINAAQMMNKGVPYQEVIQTVSNGNIAPNPISEMYNSVTSGFKGISDTANNLVNSIGQNLLPGADPMIQKAASNFVVNTAMTGDPEAALKNTALSFGGTWAGQQVFNQTGSNVLANATKAGIPAAIGSGDIGTGLISAGIAGGGTEVANLTNSPFLGKAAGTIAGTAIGGGDVGNSILGLGASQVSPLLGTAVKTALGPDTPAPISNIAQRVTQNTANNAITGAPKTVPIGSLVGPLAQAATGQPADTNAPGQIASNALTSTLKRYTPTQLMSTSNLIPIALNSGLSKLLKQTG